MYLSLRASWDGLTAEFLFVPIFREMQYYFPKTKGAGEGIPKNVQGLLKL